MPMSEPTQGSSSSSDATRLPSSPPIPLTSSRCPRMNATLSGVEEGKADMEVGAKFDLSSAHRYLLHVGR